ncbi:hypothetical protein AAY473_030593 [Plecturocebus cupreus]
MSGCSFYTPHPCCPGNTSSQAFTRPGTLSLPSNSPSPCADGNGDFTSQKGGNRKAREKRLCKVRWLVLTVGALDQMVSLGSVSEGIPFLPPPLSPHYQWLAKRRDTCPVYELTDFAKEGLNKITFFLALRREDATFHVANPLPSVMLIANMRPDVVAHTCNPSMLGGRGRQIMRSRDLNHPGQYSETLSLLKTQKLVGHGGASTRVTKHPQASSQNEGLGAGRGGSRLESQHFGRLRRADHETTWDDTIQNRMGTHVSHNCCPVGAECVTTSNPPCMLSPALTAHQDRHSVILRHGAVDGIIFSKRGQCPFGSRESEHPALGQDWGSRHSEKSRVVNDGKTGDQRPGRLSDSKVKYWDKNPRLEEREGGQECAPLRFGSDSLAVLSQRSHDCQPWELVSEGGGDSQDTGG